MTSQALSGFTTQKNTRGVWLTVGLLVLFIAMVLALFLNRFFFAKSLTPEDLSNDTVRVLNQPRPLELGQLISQKNTPVTIDFFTGHWSLLFFGFTHCPDVCPTTLNELNLAIKQLPPNLARQVKATLVSVDPARDTPEVLANYVGLFNESFSGITGEFVDLKILANSVSVPFFKVANTNEHAAHMGEADYVIDHGAQIVLVNPDGQYHGFFKAPANATAIAKQLPMIIAAY